MRTTKHFLTLVMLCCIFTACEKADIDITSDNSNQLLLPDLSREEAASLLYSYLEYADNGYYLSISKSNAINLGVNTETYDEFSNCLEDINTHILKVKQTYPNVIIHTPDKTNTLIQYNPTYENLLSETRSFTATGIIRTEAAGEWSYTSLIKLPTTANAIRCTFSCSTLIASFTIKTSYKEDIVENFITDIGTSYKTVNVMVGANNCLGYHGFTTNALSGGRLAWHDYFVNPNNN